MGSPPRLKQKTQYHYRSGSTNESQNYRYCQHVVPDHKTVGIGGTILALEPRCKIFGLSSGRRYRVRLDHTCNAQAFDRNKAEWLKEEE